MIKVTNIKLKANESFEPTIFFSCELNLEKFINYDKNANIMEQKLGKEILTKLNEYCRDYEKIKVDPKPDAFNSLVILAIIGLCTIPLAIWKVIDIIIFLVKHIHFVIK